ncbi:MAG: aminotransferase class V-fold PLP-dependent enzyme [Longimicrobiales bacterium]
MASVLPDLSAVRDAEFPLLGDGIFLNAASYGPMPQRALSAVADHDRRHAAAQLTESDFVPPQAAARAAVADLIGAKTREIALVPNTNVGVNLAAAMVRQLANRGDPRRTILLSQCEFPANVYPWLSLEAAGFKVQFVKTDKLGCLREDALIEELKGDVIALALSAVQFASGYRADLKVIGEACRKADIFFAVDAIQQVGAVPIDVSTMDVDLLACGAQKWLCSPYGSGFAYIAPRWIEELAPDLPGWLAYESSYDYTRLVHYDRTLWHDARRFEVGTLAFQSFAGLTESVSLFCEIGVDNIWEHIKALQQPLLDFADAGGIKVVSPRDEVHRSGIIALRLPNNEMSYTALRLAGVTCSIREKSLRVAPHFYNTMAEMERVVRILTRSMA